jgi:hypothetical protein
MFGDGIKYIWSFYWRFMIDVNDHQQSLRLPQIAWLPLEGPNRMVEW